MECCRRSELTSTSDLHEEIESGESAVEPFGEPCEPTGARVGLYSNPHTLDLIEVPGAGYSKFWIAFGLGKSVFPRFAENRIDYAEPRVVELAQASFGTMFVEGCSWG